MPQIFNFNVNNLNKELEYEMEPGQELEEEDFEELQARMPQRPSFPTGVFLVALAKDSIDIFSVLFTFGLLGTIVNIFAWIILRIWLMGKVSFIKQRLYRKFIGRVVWEFVPLLNIVPWWTIFVFRAYALENETLNKIFGAVERLMGKHSKDVDTVAGDIASYAKAA